MVSSVIVIVSETSVEVIIIIGKNLIKHLNVYNTMTSIILKLQFIIIINDNG